MREEAVAKGAPVEAAAAGIDLIEEIAPAGVRT
jgi:hypothetical protein